mgnify:FL=1
MTDTKYGVTTKVASIDLPHDLQGRLLEVELQRALETFVMRMEQRGWRLYSHPSLPKNPVWTTDGKGKMAAYLAIDWQGEYTGTKRAQEKQLTGDDSYTTRDAHRGQLPTPRERTLEDSDGMVEYRCVGVFLAPETPVEIAVNSYERKQRERADRKPVIFGPTGSPLI